MNLLLKSDIQTQINQHIKGNVARIGGKMNQLVNYKDAKVTDINILDGGYGKVRNTRSIQSIYSWYKAKKRQLRQEVMWIKNGESEMRDRKTYILDMHFARTKPDLKARFNAAISSNVIEHSPNPIWFMLNFHYITKENGYQYHAIPNYRYTFDQYRVPTTLTHMIEDFENMIGFEDQTHNADYSQSAIEKHGHQREFHKTYPVSYPFMHFHVFDESNVKALMEFMFEDVTVDCIVTDKFHDNLVLFKNKLNPDFINNYQTLIQQYDQKFSTVHK